MTFFCYNFYFLKNFIIGSFTKAVVLADVMYDVQWNLLCLCFTFTHIAGEANSNLRPEDTSAAPTSSVLFREIHKNAWLKRLPSMDKKTTGAFPKV